MTAFFLVLQYYYAYNYKEPFPAVMMPRFGNGKFEKDVYTFKKFSLKVFYSDSSIKEFSEHDLLNDITKPQRVGVVRNVLANPKLDVDLNNNIEFKEWLKRKTKIQDKQILKIQLLYNKLFYTKDINKLPKEKLVLKKEINYENQ